MSDEFELVALRGGGWSVRGVPEKETFHPAVGPAVESHGLYAEQLRLAERARAAPGEFVVWDVGLGAGANVGAALAALAEAPARVHVVSFDRTLAPLKLALRHPAELGLHPGLVEAFAQLADTGRAHVRLGESDTVWETRLGDFPALVESMEARDWPKPHAILWDPFSPAKNPAMWTLPLFASVRALVGDWPCQLATYSRATLIRTALLLAGWRVGRGAATGEKEETTLAATQRALVGAPLDAAWLDRVRRSTSAEPLTGDAYRQAPLSDAAWECLRALPQFSAP